MPTDLLVEYFECVLSPIVSRLQCCYRIEEHTQGLGGVCPVVHVPPFLAAVRLGKQPPHQLDEHRHGVIGQFLAELDHLRDDQGVTTARIKVAGQPRRRGIALANHLVPPPGSNAHPQTGIDPERAQERNPLG